MVVMTAVVAVVAVVVVPVAMVMMMKPTMQQMPQDMVVVMTMVHLFSQARRRHGHFTSSLQRCRRRGDGCYGKHHEAAHNRKGKIAVHCTLLR